MLASHAHVDAVGLEELAIEHVAASIAWKTYRQVRREGVHAVATERLSGEHERHLGSERRGTERAAHGVEAIGAFPCPVRKVHVKAEVTDDARDEEAVAVVGDALAVDVELCGLGSEHAARELSAHEASCEHFGDDACGGGETEGLAGATGVIRVEKARNEPKAENEAHAGGLDLAAVDGHVVTDLERPKRHVFCRAAHEGPEQRACVGCTVSANAEVSPDGADRAPRDHGDVGKRLRIERAAHLGQTGHQRAVPPRKHDGSCVAVRDRTEDVGQFVERARLAHQDVRRPRLPQGVEKRAFFAKMEGVSIDDDDDRAAQSPFPVTRLGSPDSRILLATSLISSRVVQRSPKRLFRSLAFPFVALVALAALAVSGCASPAVRYAERGDIVALRAEIAKEHAKGSLSNGEARDIAKALIDRDVAALEGDADKAKSAIPELRACAKDVASALESRVDKHDAMAAAIAKLLVEEGIFSPGDTKRFRDDPDPAFRSLSARRLTSSSDEEARKVALLAREVTTRQMAALAAGDGAVLGELDALFEVARLDPDAEVRHLAMRAAVDAVARNRSDIVDGLTSSSNEDERRALTAARVALDRLRDAWTTGSKGLRDDIASGFATSPFYELGGREALRARLGEGGPDRLVLVSAILRMGTSRSEAEDTFLRENAARVAVSALRDGSTLERSFAVILVRPEGEGLEALQKASRDADQDVVLSAMGKLLHVPSEANRARVELVRFAGRKDDLVHAPRARGILAGARYLPVQLWLEEQATQKKAVGLRLRAVAGLAALGRVARGAPLLADEDPRVRARAACLVLAATR